MDTFLEYLIPKRKGPKDMLKILGTIILGVILSVAIGFFASISVQWMFMIWFALFVVVWYGVYVLISRQNIEYEYIFTNGELDIDIIYSKRRRVHFLSVRVREFLICAPAYSEAFKSKYIDISGVKKNFYATGNLDSPRMCFAEFMQNGDKVRLYFEPPAKLLEAIKRFNVRNVFLFDEQN